MKKSNVFLDIMSSYLTKYTVVTKGLSENTIRSYTYTFQLLFVFLKEQKDIPPEKVQFKALDRNTLELFLLWLERSRECIRRILKRFYILFAHISYWCSQAY